MPMLGAMLGALLLGCKAGELRGRPEAAQGGVASSRRRVQPHSFASRLWRGLLAQKWIPGLQSGPREGFPRPRGTRRALAPKCNET